jgi:hypothetical protein
MANQGTRVDIGEDRNLELFEILFGNLLRAPVGANAGELADDEAFDVRTRGFVVVGVGSGLVKTTICPA